jgi:hypothetical protein
MHYICKIYTASDTFLIFGVYFQDLLIPDYVLIGFASLTQTTRVPEYKSTLIIHVDLHVYICIW